MKENLMIMEDPIEWRSQFCSTRFMSTYERMGKSTMVPRRTDLLIVDCTVVDSRGRTWRRAWRRCTSTGAPARTGAASWTTTAAWRCAAWRPAPPAPASASATRPGRCSTTCSTCGSSSSATSTPNRPPSAASSSVDLGHLLSFFFVFDS